MKENTKENNNVISSFIRTIARLLAFVLGEPLTSAEAGIQIPQAELMTSGAHMLNGNSVHASTVLNKVKYPVTFMIPTYEFRKRLVTREWKPWISDNIKGRYTYLDQDMDEWIFLRSEPGYVVFAKSYPAEVLAQLEPESTVH